MNRETAERCTISADLVGSVHDLQVSQAVETAMICASIGTAQRGHAGPGVRVHLLHRLC